MNTVNEPIKNWGGNWTEEKLEAFQKYVDAYLTIMNAQKRKFNGWPTTIYFDGFAGSGKRISLPNTPDCILFSDYLVQHDIYKGSAQRVLSLEKKFDHYYFVDIDENSICSLKNTLETKGLISDKCHFIRNDVNAELIRFSEFMNKNMAALVLLDPFGMQINWSSIEQLKDKRVDIWILIPSGVIINRFLDKQGKLLYIDKLINFYGLKEEDIRNIFYETKKENTLFGEENVISKTNDSINKIASLYIKRLNTIWKFATEEPLKLFNTKNVPIYHFVFASNNETAKNIAQQIIKKKN